MNTFTEHPRDQPFHLSHGYAVLPFGLANPFSGSNCWHVEYLAGGRTKLGSFQWEDWRRYFRRHSDELAFYARTQDAQHAELGTLDRYG